MSAHHIIVALPDPVESGAVSDWISADGFEPVRRTTPRAVLDEMRARRFDLLIMDAAFPLGGVLRAAGAAARTAPILVVGDPGAAPPQAAGSAGSLLPRPIDRTLLSCFVSMALLDERPVRRSERKPIDRFDAMVNGVPAAIIDVSAEGMRLEIAQGRHVLPPRFVVQIPLIGIGVTVQRMWTRAMSRTIWCGGALSQNRAGLEQAWRSLVSTLPVRGEQSIQRGVWCSPGAQQRRPTFIPPQARHSIDPAGQPGAAADVVVRSIHVGTFDRRIRSAR